MILPKTPGQEREFHFPPNVQVPADHAPGMLMRLAADGEWRVASPLNMNELAWHSAD